MIAERIRTALAAESSTREVAMFGGVSFMVNEKMIVAVLSDGDLLVRINPARHSELTARLDAKQAEMGAGRTMGPSWISVARDSIGTKEALSFWLDIAMEYNAKARGGDEDRLRQRPTRATKRPKPGRSA